MATWKIKKGDSLWLDIIADEDDITAIDATWANFSGVWQIKSALADLVPVAYGTMMQTTTVGKFRFNLSTNNSALCAEGTYYLVFEINNTLQSYREETHDRLVVESQGVLP